MVMAVITFRSWRMDRTGGGPGATAFYIFAALILLADGVLESGSWFEGALLGAMMPLGFLGVLWQTRGRSSGEGT
jgi:hypothetical protein